MCNETVMPGKTTVDQSHVCARCAEQYPTCCRISPGMEASCFPISSEELARLAPHAATLGVPPVVEEPNTETFVQALHKLFPGYCDQLRLAFPLHQLHFRLRVSAGGECLFLGKKGCVLPIPDRPYYCRLYPFWFINSTVFTFTSSQCLAVNNSASTAGLYALFKTDQPTLRILHDSLRIAWGLHTDELRPR